MLQRRMDIQGMQNPAASFRNVTFTYPGSDTPLIENLNFTIAQGEFVALIGPSGCGKSTIFRLLNRLNEPQSGEIRIFGKGIPQEIRDGNLAEKNIPQNVSGGNFTERNVPQNVSDGNFTERNVPQNVPGENFTERNVPQNISGGNFTERNVPQNVPGDLTGKPYNSRRSRRQAAPENIRCGYMPQQDMLFPWRTVLENVRLPLELQGCIGEKEMNDRAAEALKDVGLEDWRHRLPRELSGGMRQRVSFARTLMTGAEMLLLDEPFSALDYLTRLSMREWLLEQWEKDKKTILFITHDVEEAVFLSSRILAVEKKPVRELREYSVPVPRPRTEASLAAPEALALKAQLIRLFRESTMTSL